MTIKTLEVAGLSWSAPASRLSHRSQSDHGPGDKKLLLSLAKAGDEHAKSLRGAVVWVEIDAPRYWWHEFVTYRIGCEQLGSESTMHDQPRLTGQALLEFKRDLPEGTMQKRIFMISYQTLRRMYLQRRRHRLPEWQEFCNWIEGLPEADLIISSAASELERLREENERLRFELAELRSGK